MSLCDFQTEDTSNTSACLRGCVAIAQRAEHVRARVCEPHAKMVRPKLRGGCSRQHNRIVG
jgi:hypothetical protein